MRAPTAGAERAPCVLNQKSFSGRSRYLMENASE
jgi:hypothetical protein